jgi:hypothetical protein
MKSLGQKIQQLEGLIGTKDLSTWENDFLQSVLERSNHGKNTPALSERQAEVAERIWGKHFA